MKALTLQKSKWTNFIGIALLLLVLIIADLVTTYMCTPDLSRESNSLVTIYGYGWKELIIRDIIIFIVLLVIAYFPFVYYKRSVIQCEGFKEYVSMLFFDRPDKFKLTLIKSPKRKSLILVTLGYMLTIGFIALKVYCVINNILVKIGFVPCIFCLFKIPHSYHNTIHFHTAKGIVYVPVIMYAVMVFIDLFTYFYWYLKEYKINKKALDNLENAFE